MSITLDIGAGHKPQGDINIDIIPNLFCDVAGDAQLLPFRQNIFYKIYCSQVLEHLDRPFSALNEMKRVLKINGLAEIDVPKKKFTNSAKYCLLYFIFNFPFIIINPKYLKWIITRLIKIRKRDIGIFHKHIISSTIISKYFKIEKTTEFGNILYSSINNKIIKRKINSAYLFYCKLDGETNEHK